ncbi:hypothetical protein CYMTET_17840 [Cymbomonas tetramitiformis]|uniref:Uncharacterized protein n=1 Tax=Cymbomonas tetramitiformis TaxID=36881 RepID=A0AAE0L6I6_9CHLO|nr:hypothetical protein CYMTET_17840 [Cymbomonas tetramitiformis]
MPACLPWNRRLSSAGEGPTADAGVILILILIPMSFQYVHYHEYALLQSRTTGEVFTEKVYAVRGLSPPLGRLLGGPAPLYLYYRAAGLLGGS